LFNVVFQFPTANAPVKLVAFGHPELGKPFNTVLPPQVIETSAPALATGKGLTVRETTLEVSEQVALLIITLICQPFQPIKAAGKLYVAALTPNVSHPFTPSLYCQL
jgi:hypothetical protein